MSDKNSAKIEPKITANITFQKIKIDTGYKDKYGNKIYVGSKVRFRYYNHEWTERVIRFKNDYLPFAICREEVAIGGIDPTDCVVIKEF